MAETKRYTKKPVTIEALEWTGDNISEIEKFVGKTLDHGLTPQGPFIVIPTLEGRHNAAAGDLIIKGVKGEFYPCKPDIFAMTYSEGEV